MVLNACKRYLELRKAQYFYAKVGRQWVSSQNRMGGYFVGLYSFLMGARGGRGRASRPVDPCLVFGGVSSYQEAAAKVFSSAEGPYMAGTGILFMRR